MRSAMAEQSVVTYDGFQTRPTHTSIGGTSAAYDAAKNIFEVIATSIHAGARVSIFGFGTFSLAERKARTGRNPQTGAALKIAASKSIKFKAASSQKKTGKK